jgi:uncharacterized protein YidB (DUF937 family)
MKRNTMPSLAALLGLLAVAGYQNRDKLTELLKNATAAGTAGEPGAAAGAGGGVLGDVVKGVTGMFGTATGPGGVLSGLNDVIDGFRNAGHGAAADSWVSKGPNQPVTPAATETALGGDLINMLVKQTGLSREDLLARLAQVLPEAIDKMSPQGKLPAA